MAKRYKINSFNGHQKIVSPENSDLKKISFSAVKSPGSGKYTGNTNGEESVFVITSGHVKFFSGKKLLGEMKRQSVFTEPPYAVYLPPYSSYTMEFIEKSEICVASVQAKGTGKQTFLKPQDIKFKRAGQETFFRNINEVIPEGFPAEKIIIGETIVDQGNWSSYPPHKHDRDNIPEESALEELYFFKIKPKAGFGTIRVFGDTEDNIFLIQHDEVITIPHGYHTLGVIPRHQMYYLWILAGDKKKLLPFMHPDYDNVNEKNGK